MNQPPTSQATPISRLAPTHCSAFEIRLLLALDEPLTASRLGFRLWTPRSRLARGVGGEGSRHLNRFTKPAMAALRRLQRRGLVSEHWRRYERQWERTSLATNFIRQNVRDELQEESRQ